jgi:hypothetical protein
MAAPGDIGDLPQKGAIKGGLLHETQALLQLAQGLVFLGQCLLQLHHLWGSRLVDEVGMAGYRDRSALIHFPDHVHSVHTFAFTQLLPAWNSFFFLV